MVKRFRITERTQFEFRIDAINVFNHPNFANPNTSINSIGSFGQISSTLNGQPGAANPGGNGGSRSFVINSRINF
jgi:hypothetical protein